jgi:hypothetical protein
MAPRIINKIEWSSVSISVSQYNIYLYINHLDAAKQLQLEPVYHTGYRRC